jgi:hypothetical protein
MEIEDVIEALESTTPNRKAGDMFSRTNANKYEIRNHRDYLLRFLSELDSELTIGEVREILDDYV